MQFANAGHSRRCLQNEIKASRYPKHSGDIMLLARIYWLQDKKAEAQELASRTITMRRGWHVRRAKAVLEFLIRCLPCPECSRPSERMC
ncbi:hypothetical protein V8F33_003381 [Rhypophila sp. PSN 637]